MYGLQALLVVVLYLSLSTFNGQDNVEGNVVWRTSLGAVFHPVTRINNANSAWLHVYKVPRLKPLALPDVPDLCEAIAVILHNWDLQSTDAPITVSEPPPDEDTGSDPEQPPNDESRPNGPFMSQILNVLYNKKIRAANASTPVFEPPLNDDTRQDSPSNRRSPNFANDPHHQLTYADNYLYQQCQKYQITASSTWKQINLVDDGIEVNLKAISSLLEESTLYWHPISNDTIMNAPHDESSNEPRRKRAPLKFVSAASKKLFGFATQKDLVKFARCIRLMYEHDQEQDIQIEAVSDALQSYSQETNAKITGLARVINHLRKIYKEVTTTLYNNQEQLDLRISKLEMAYSLHGSMVNNVLSLAFQRLALFQSYYALIRERMSAVEALVTKNTLSPLLVSPIEMKRLFSKIRRLLQKRHPHFSIAVNDIGFMYRTPGVAYTWDEDNIYVQVRIPVSAYDSRYLVYRPSAIALPLSEEQPFKLTKLTKVPELFAVSFDQHFYFELTQNELNSCVGRTDKYCLYAFPVIGSVTPSCMSSIFWNQYTDARRLCDVLYIQTNEPTRLLQPISSHTYLSVAQPGDDWYLACSRQGPKYIKPVIFGIFDLPCGCSLRTNKYFLSSNIDGCNYTTTSEIVSQRVNNVMYLAQSLNESQVKKKQKKTI